MNYELVKLFEEGKPSDQQSACIRYFFEGGADDIFVPAGFPKFGDRDGSDEETFKMINYALAGPFELEPHIRKMLEEWKTEGF